MVDQKEKRPIQTLEIVREVIRTDQAVEAYRELLEIWEKQSEKHKSRIAVLEEKERGLQDRIEAQQSLHKSLRVEIDEMRQVLAEQLTAGRARKAADMMGQSPEVAQYIRAAQLLIQPGRKLTNETLRALGIPPPTTRNRPSEHYARSVATLVLPALGFEIIESRGAHPDLICRYEGEVIGVEVEVGLRDYDNHGHDAAHAHVVVCWEPPAIGQLQDGFFSAKFASDGCSRMLSVVTLQTPQIFGNPFATGKKQFSYNDGQRPRPALVGRS